MRSRRTNAATEGPWVALEHGLNVDLAIVCETTRGADRPNPIAWPDDANLAADARFIAAARTDVPRMVETVRQLRTALDALARGSECANAVDAYDENAPWDALLVKCGVPPIGYL